MARRETHLQRVRAEHVPSYSRRRLGRGAVSGRTLYGWTVECSCGWSQATNEPKREAESWWREHTSDVADKTKED